MNKIRLYSPNQILLIVFLSGPLGMIYTLSRNFESLNDAKASRMTILWGSLFLVAVYFLSIFIPKNVSLQFGIGFGCMMFSHRVATLKQMTKEAIQASDKFGFFPIGNVLGSTIILAILNVIAIVIFVILVRFILTLLGLDGWLPSIPDHA